MKQMPMNLEKNQVAHFVKDYLFRNGTWIHSQIVSAHAWVPHVLCIRTENLNDYPVPHIFAINNLPFPFTIINKLFVRSWGYFPAFKSYIQKKTIKLIHAHFGPTGWASLPLARTCKVPVVTTFYGNDLSTLPNVNPLWRKRYSDLFVQGHKFLVEGTHMRDQLLKLGCPADKAIVKRLGVNTALYKYVPRTVAFDGIIRILISGTFTEKKGIPYAVRAFGMAYRKNRNLRLTIIGDARPNKPEDLVIKQEIMALINEYQINEAVALLGFQPHNTLVNQYYKHHIFLSPSVQAATGDNEGGSPVSITEASATGMAVISTVHCDIPAVVKNGLTGLLAKERDSDELFRHLEVFVNQPELIHRFGVGARKHIETEYELKVTARHLENIYNDCLASATHI